MTMLKDKVVLITGAGMGIGRVTAIACAREGARVAAQKVGPTGKSVSKRSKSSTRAST